MNQEPTHHLQIAFRDKDNQPITQTRYRLNFLGQRLTGTTDEKGHTELVQGGAGAVEMAKSPSGLARPRRDR